MIDTSELQIAYDADTGDTVYHTRTGETWEVAHVAGGHLFWMGWPFGCVRLGECLMVKKASEEERLKILKEVARSSANDARVTTARNRLDLMGVEWKP